MHACKANFATSALKTNWDTQANYPVSSDKKISTRKKKSDEDLINKELRRQKMLQLQKFVDLSYEKRMQESQGIGLGSRETPGSASAPVGGVSNNQNNNISGFSIIALLIEVLTKCSRKIMENNKNLSVFNAQAENQQIDKEVKKNIDAINNAATKAQQSAESKGACNIIEDVLMIAVDLVALAIAVASDGALSFLAIAAAAVTAALLAAKTGCDIAGEEQACKGNLAAAQHDFGISSDLGIAVTVVMMFGMGVSMGAAALNTAMSAAVETGEEIAETAQNIVQTTAEDTVNETEEGVQGASGSVEEGVQGTNDSVEAAGRTTEDTVENTINETEESTQSVANSIEESTQSSENSVEESTETVSENTREMREPAEEEQGTENRAETEDEARARAKREINQKRFLNYRRASALGSFVLNAGNGIGSGISKGIAAAGQKDIALMKADIEFIELIIALLQSGEKSSDSRQTSEVKSYSDSLRQLSAQFYALQNSLSDSAASIAA